MLAKLKSLMAGLLHRDRVETDMLDEMRFHLDAAAADLMTAGMSPAEAARQARIRFGSVEAVREDARAGRGLRFFDEVRQDLRFAARQLRRAPLFAAAAIVSLALGIGANTAIFSLMDAVLLRALPVNDPGDLVFLAHVHGTDAPSTSSNYPLYERYRQLDVFSGVTTYSWESFAVSSPDGGERVEGQYVSGNYHRVVGVPMQLGRGFADEPDRPDGRAPIAVISDEFWARRFGRRADVIGQVLTIDGRAVTIAGVTQPEFRGIEAGARHDVTLPLFVRVLADPGFLAMRDGWVSTMLIARIKPGVTREQAVAATDAIFRRYWMEPENAWARRRPDASAAGAILPADRGTDRLRQQYEKPLWVLMAMVGVVLVIACSNVANLLLARATSRTHEIALRLSIGAGRARLVRQLLTESLLLSLLGGLLGLLVAGAVSTAIPSIFGVGLSPILVEADLNVRVLLFTIGVCIATGVGFGLVPALRATQGIAPVLHEGAGLAAAPGRLRGIKVLVAMQVALCLLTLTGAGLLVRTLNNLRAIDAGFARQHVLMFNVQTDTPGLTEQGRLRFYGDLVDRLRALPGVASVSLSKRSPIDYSSEDRRLEIPGETPREAGVSTSVVTPDYFLTLGLSLVRGRTFTDADRDGSSRVAIVSTSMADAFFAGSDPVGRVIIIGGNRTPLTIVGVVSDVRQEQLRDAPTPLVYSPLAQPDVAFDGSTGFPRHVTAVMRTRSDAPSLATAARRAAVALNPGVTITYMRTMEQQLDAALIRERLLASLATGFGVLAFLLAFVGLYGVMSYSVTRREQEIALRMALGAERKTVLWQVMRETMVVATAGIGLGTLGVLATTRLVSALLFGLSPRDPFTIGVAAMTLLTALLLAGSLPAARASRLEPMRALTVR